MADELVDDLTQTSFRKALDAADGTVSVLDAGGKCFTRVWCCYEIFISLAVQQFYLTQPQIRQGQVRACQLGARGLGT